jgi:hypothetical protein
MRERGPTIDYSEIDRLMRGKLTQVGAKSVTIKQPNSNYSPRGTLREKSEFIRANCPLTSKRL